MTIASRANRAASARSRALGALASRRVGLLVGTSFVAESRSSVDADTLDAMDAMDWIFGSPAMDTAGSAMGGARSSDVTNASHGLSAFSMEGAPSRSISHLVPSMARMMDKSLSENASK